MSNNNCVYVKLDDVEQTIKQYYNKLRAESLEPIFAKPDENDIELRNTLNSVAAFIKHNIQIANAEPARHGRWVEINTGNTQWVQFGVPQNKCSECNSEFMNKTPFCPDCGAKMDEVSDND